jgi:DNA helicase-2/ATP-dependent DNA helicase PcrA
MHMVAGVLNAVGLLNLEHLVVDEYQDLNPMDLDFVDSMITQGAAVFVAGDDDQSIYSFRFASPAGIQGFVAKYPTCGQHTLNACFRSTPSVLAAAQTLIGANPQPNRIPKNQQSLYVAAAPPLTGMVHRWRFAAGVGEARAVAESCRDLIAAGISPRDILVLLSNQRALLPRLGVEFDEAGIAYEPPRSEGFLDSQAGRFVLAMIRIVCDVDDYVAHRVLLGLQRGIGVGTCNTVAEAVIANNLNYRSIFYQPLPAGVFGGRALTGLNRARALCAQLQGWQATDTVGDRMNDISTVLTATFDPAATQMWQAFVNTLPAQMVLEELRDYLWADTDEQQEFLLGAVLERLNLPIPAAGVLPPRVRVMTMHGAKGLSAKIVFVPGLEEEILPGPWRQPFPGLILEAARLLYVSVTRARAACVVSFAQTRILNGQFRGQTPSRFIAQLGGAFAPRAAGLSGAEVTQIVNQVAQL